MPLQTQRYPRSVFLLRSCKTPQTMVAMWLCGKKWDRFSFITFPWDISNKFTYIFKIILLRFDRNCSKWVYQFGKQLTYEYLLCWLFILWICYISPLIYIFYKFSSAFYSFQHTIFLNVLVDLYLNIPLSFQSTFFSLIHILFFCLFPVSLICTLIIPIYFFFLLWVYFAFLFLVS